MMKDVPGCSGQGRVRTDLSCTECQAGFIAELDFAIDGNHVVECPRCGHEHCRTIKNGQITEARWASRNGQPRMKGRSFWKSSVLPLTTSVAQQYIRDLWLNRVGE
jgi:DNA-directed RNA polymerase subunit RPC12/RpoP